MDLIVFVFMTFANIDLSSEVSCFLIQHGKRNSVLNFLFLLDQEKQTGGRRPSFTVYFLNSQFLSLLSNYQSLYWLSHLKQTHLYL